MFNYRTVLARYKPKFSAFKFSSNSNPLFTLNLNDSKNQTTINTAEMASSLNLFKIADYKDSVVKLSNNSSVIKSFLLSKIDSSLFNLPSIIDKKDHIFEVFNQANIVKSCFRDFVNDKETLKKLGFYHLWKLSFTEMMIIFEAIGSNLAITFDDLNYRKVKLTILNIHNVNAIIFFFSNFQTIINNCDVSEFGSSNYPSLNLKTQQSVLQLIAHNSLSFASLEFCKNSELKKKLNCDLKNGKMLKIGFAWNEEKTSNLGFNDWNSKAILTLNKNWIIMGHKCAIVTDDYDYYAIFCGTNDYGEDGDLSWLLNKTSPPTGIVGLLIPASWVDIQNEVINGIEYQKIVFDSLEVPQENVLTNCSRFGVSSLNVHGSGLLAVSSYLLGQLKSLLKDTYQLLIKNHRIVLNSQSIERICCDITHQIYALESSIYLTASLYDLYDHVNSNSDVYLEAFTCLMIALQSIRTTLESLQPIWQSKAWITSPFIDLLNIFETTTADYLSLKMFFANCSIDYFLNENRLNLDLLKMSPYYEANLVKNYIREKKKEKFLPIIDTLKLESQVPSILGNLSFMLSHSIQQVDSISKSTVAKWIQVSVLKFTLLIQSFYFTFTFLF